MFSEIRSARKGQWKLLSNGWNARRCWGGTYHYYYRLWYGQRTVGLHKHIPCMTLGLCWLLSTANWLSQQACRYFAAQLPRSLSNFTAIGALWTPISSIGNIPDFIILHVWYCYYPEETRERSMSVVSATYLQERLLWCQVHRPKVVLSWPKSLNKLKQRQNRRYFTGEIFRCILLNKMSSFLIQIPVELLLMIHIMAWSCIHVTIYPHWYT